MEEENPQGLFASLGFGFVHWFLWLVLGGCALGLSGVLGLGWVLQGDVTIRAQGDIQPASRRLIKSAIAARVEEVHTRTGEWVEEEDILVVLSSLDTDQRLTRVEGELALSDARSGRLAGEIDQDRLVLAAVVASRRLDVERAALALDHVRREQQLYSQHASADWPRRATEDLLPVRESAAALAQARAQLAIAERRLEANEIRLVDLQLERQTRRQLSAERQDLWERLEHTVIRAPVDGVVLTEDLDLRIGDHVGVGETLLELAANNTWSARVLIQQIDRPKIRTGQRARVFIRAYPHLEYGVFEGRVAAIGEQAAAAGGAYRVDVVLDAPSLPLADGMAAEVYVSIDSGRLLQLAWKRLLRELGRLPVPALRQARG